ncbi:MAG: substrate-binding domain-containing protein, partial [Planctomycetota bacterium]
GVVGTSSQMSEADIERCEARGITQVTEVSLGYGGIILANGGRRGFGGGRRGGFGLDLIELYLAAAAYVPENDACVLVPNPNTDWSDLDGDLPNAPIRIFGPPVRSVNRSLFIDRALAEGARQIDCLAELERRDPAAFERAVMPRHDEVWLDAGENDDAIAAALPFARNAIGVIGWDTFRRTPSLNAVPLGGIVPNQGAFLSGQYPLVRPLYLYVTPGALAEPSVSRLVTRLAAGDNAPSAKVYSTASGPAAPVSQIDKVRRVKRYQ